MHDATPELISEFIANAKHIIIMQADNPDGDSLGSSLALEAILSELGKEVTMYCGVIVPTYLRYLEGWDRVVSELPRQFDAVINKSPERQLLNNKPCLVIDHHPAEVSIPYATLVYNQLSVATGEIIYELAKQFGWPLPLEACNMLATSILSDSLGLMSEGTSARSIHIIGELVERGVQLAELENRRRETMRKSPTMPCYSELDTAMTVGLPTLLFLGRKSKNIAMNIIPLYWCLMKCVWCTVWTWLSHLRNTLMAN